MYKTKRPSNLYLLKPKCRPYKSTHDLSSSTYQDVIRYERETGLPHPGLHDCINCNGERVEKGLAHKCFKEERRLK